MRWAVKRLGGWDAMLLCSETPHVHMHTLKVAVIDATDFEGDYSFDRFCSILHRRLHLLEPLRYRLVDIPFKAAPSDVAGELRNRLRLPRPARPGGQPRWSP